MCLHFSGLSFRRPSCGISLYDFTIRAGLQLIFSCGICHSWTHFISAKVGPYLSKMYTFSTKPHTTRKEQRNNTDKSEYTSANLQMRFFSHLPSFCFIITVLTSYFTKQKTGSNFFSNLQTLKQIGPQSSFPLFMIYHSFMISEQTKRKNLPHFQVKFRLLLLHCCDFRNHLLLGFYLKRAHILGFFIWQVLMCNDPYF